jgi:hypothetical protein
MRSLLEGLWLQAVVLWLAPLAEQDDGSLGRNLLFVSAPVVEALRSLVREIVVPPWAGRPRDGGAGGTRPGAAAARAGGSSPRLEGSASRGPPGLGRSRQP